MVTPEEFWALIDHYGAEVFPLHLVFAAVAVVLAVLVARKPGSGTTLLVKLFLAACYTWIGIVYYLIFSRPLSAPVGYVQPIGMLGITALLCVDAVTGRTRFAWPTRIEHRVVSVTLVVYSIVGYPLVGWALGHSYVVKVTQETYMWVPIVGLFASPTTVLALAFYGPALPRADRWVMIGLVLWAVPSVLGPPLRNYGVYEDLGLVVAGVYGLFMLIRRWRATDLGEDDHDRPRPTERSSATRGGGGSPVS